MTATALRITAVKNNALACSSCHRYIREGRTVYVVDNRPVCDLCGDPDPAARIAGRESLDTVAVCKRIKAALRARSGKDWSVTRGRGTAGGWISIDVPKARKSCSLDHQWGEDGRICRHCGLDWITARSSHSPITCPGHDCDDACRHNAISPAECIELGALLDLERVHDQGVSIMSSTDAYIEYIDRAEGRQPRRFGVAYWD